MMEVCTGDPFVAQLADLARSQRAANKWVFVPTNSLGWMLAERLVLEGCNWVNLRFTTPFQLALEAAAPDLLAEGINPCPEHLGPSLLQSLLFEHPTHPFAPLILQPGMAEALWKTLGELRMAGVGGGQLDSIYQSYLDEHRLADRAMVFQRAAATKVREGDYVLAYPYCAWSPLIRTFLEALPGHHLVPWGTDLEPPRRLRGTRQPVPTRSLAQAEFFHAGRRDIEFQEILRRIEGPFDQVEIAAHREDLPLLRDILAAHRCPVTFDEGLPLNLSRAGQAFTGLLQWLEEGLTGFQARELLLANLLKAPPDSWTAARLVKAAQIAWGRGEYRRKLTALADRSSVGENPPLWLLQQAGQARHLADWFDRLFEKLPSPVGGRVPLLEWLQGLQRIVADDLEQDDEVTGALVAVLEEMKQLPQAEWPLEQALHLLRERLRVLRWNASRPRPGHLHVTGLAQLGLSGRTHLFATGLEEGRWVAGTTEDCVCDDEERERLHPLLARSEDVVAELSFHIAERLATLQGSVTYSYSSRDRRGDQEQVPSWLFFQAARDRRGDLADYGQLYDWLGEPVQPWNAEESELRRGSVASVLELHADLARGEMAESARDSAEFTAYDGRIPSAAGLWDPRTNGQATSVSRLQGLASCPFQFFLMHGLGLYPAPLALPEPDRWLDPATRGHILHEVYAGYGRRRRAGACPDLDFLLELLEEALRDQLSPPSATVERAERESLRRDLEHFLRLEQDRQGRTPVGVEVPFGLGDCLGEGLGRVGPVTLDLGEDTRFLLQGQIDRIDEIDGGFAVVDYKTGRHLDSGRDGMYSRGRLLQHGLYALAAEQLLGQPVIESGYYFTSAQASQDWVSFPFPERSQLGRVLRLVMDPLASGLFPHAHDSANDCRFCDFGAACAAHSDGRTRAKLDELESRRQLLEEK